MYTLLGMTCPLVACNSPRTLLLQKVGTGRSCHSPAATSHFNRQLCIVHADATGNVERSSDESASSSPAPATPAPATPTSSQTRRGILLSISAVIVGSPALALRDFATPGQALAADSRSLLAGPQPLAGDIKAAVAKAFKEKMPLGKAPVMLRLVFHDAATFDERAGDGGADASVFFELSRPENKGLKRGWRVIEEVQTALQGTAAEGRVSTADLIVLAGAYAVSMTGGPSVDIAIGRRDATAAGPADRLPAEDMAADVQRAVFAAKSLSVREMVALLGAHTLGNKGFGDPVVFDNAYYTALLAKPWAGAPKDSMANMIGLPSDKVIADDPECLPLIQEYASDQEKFFQDFSKAYYKLANLGVTWT